MARDHALIDLLSNAESSDTDLRPCIAHVTQVGQDAIERSRIDGTLAEGVTATDIAYHFVALMCGMQLSLTQDPVDIGHHIDLAVRGMARH
ncbi:hypothetical protein [Saccharopolyspora phatthalungensis]|uniref:Tetracyclin repressor-like C-terminal domain-containing protein n=1 Tax=Saccharopolyspora phatthalungensis TaxID=664693 RepID=A0A840QGB8_9PSEU|nr:hypothetical protein [Saccharopolyspora phatthalungensis]MBB5159141.1 hypothetical protein [Saccharopolyspora phatthalungensis]